MLQWWGNLPRQAVLPPRTCKENTQAGKVLVQRLLSYEQKAGHPQHEPRAASHQDFLKPDALFVLTFPNSSQPSKMLF